MVGGLSREVLSGLPDQAALLPPPQPGPLMAAVWSSVCGSAPPLWALTPSVALGVPWGHQEEGSVVGGEPCPQPRREGPCRCEQSPARAFQGPGVHKLSLTWGVLPTWLPPGHPSVVPASSEAMARGWAAAAPHTAASPETGGSAWLASEFCHPPPRPRPGTAMRSPRCSQP